MLTLTEYSVLWASCTEKKIIHLLYRFYWFIRSHWCRSSVHINKVVMSLKDGGGFCMEEFSRHRAEEAFSTWCASIHDVISLFIDNMVSMLECVSVEKELPQWLSVSTCWLNHQVSLGFSLSFYTSQLSVHRSYFNTFIVLGLATLAC